MTLVEACGCRLPSYVEQAKRGVGWDVGRSGDVEKLNDLMVKVATTCTCRLRTSCCVLQLFFEVHVCVCFYKAIGKSRGT